MDRSEHYKQEGYRQGFEDAKKTGGKIKQEIIDRYLNAETKNLSIAYSREFIDGWYKGFNAGVEELNFRLVTNDDFWGENIIWENHIYKRR